MDSEDSHEDSLDSLEKLPLSQPPIANQDESESLTSSASELLFAELSEKAKLLRIAQVQAEEYKRRCDALSTKLSVSKKRHRDEVAEKSAGPQHSGDDNPRKKPSPEAHESSASGSTPVPLPVGSFVQDSDDDVPLPGGTAKATPVTAGNRLFESLHSVLCGYKDRKIVPGSKDLPFDLCAEMCKEEAEEVQKWSPTDMTSMHKHVLSAIRLVYPNKKETWYSSKFLMHPKGAAQYWSRVLLRRAEIWRAAAKRAVEVAAKARPKSLKQRIREKIAQRRASRIRTLLPPPTSSAVGNPFKTPTRRSRSALSSSDSDSDGKKVIDLSLSPSSGSASSSSKATPPAASQPRSAPSPKYVDSSRTYIVPR